MMGNSIVSFKSIKENYDKEKSGVKPNTVRVVDNSDSRFYGTKSYKIIRIVLADNPEEFFEREIQDITFYTNKHPEFTVCIISWKHKEDCKC